MTVPRKRRENHNEIEKRRRDQQRQRLEVLRQQVPRLTSPRASAVTIITEATEYIKLLQRRVTELEELVGQAGVALPVPPQMPQFISLPAEPHTMPEDALYGFLFAHNSASTTHSSEEGSPSKFSGMPLICPVHHLPLVFSSEANVSGRGQSATLRLPPLLPKKGSLSRRDSALLLPTKDPNTFVFGKRDSIQNFFSGTLPTMFQDATSRDIFCSKCRRGVENLVMIDCDRCHSWYHVRCVGIDPVFIPLQWSCAECGH